MPQPNINFSPRRSANAADSADELRSIALAWLAERDTAAKAAGVIEMARRWQAGEMRLDSMCQLDSQHQLPGRPAKPALISPKMVKARSMATLDGRAAMIHALTHIEFNAINLALDAIWRFASMPAGYYADWLKVAAEEALHFSLLTAHLQTLGYQYGDFPAHDSLWEMCDKTRDDCLARMALVPRTLEARGLDASPVMRAKLAQAGDAAAAVILDRILHDEIGHVAVGNRWYHYLCRQQQCDPVATYARLIARYKAPVLRGPYNLKARRAAGFTEAELAILTERHI